MTAPGADVLRNTEATRRLRELVARLGPDELRRSLGGGWTVAVALTHLTFWDTRQDAALRDYAGGRELPCTGTRRTAQTIGGWTDPA